MLESGTDGHIRITQMPALPIPIERPKFVMPEKAEYLYLENSGEDEDNAKTSLTTFDKIKIAYRLVPHVFHFLRGLFMKNWKTTVGAIVAGAATALQAFGIISIPADVQMYIVGVAVFIIGLFAPDAKKNEPAN